MIVTFYGNSWRVTIYCPKREKGDGIMKASWYGDDFGISSIFVNGIFPSPVNSSLTSDAERWRFFIINLNRLFVAHVTSSSDVDPQ